MLMVIDIYSGIFIFLFLKQKKNIVVNKYKNESNHLGIMWSLISLFAVILAAFVVSVVVFFKCFDGMWYTKVTGLFCFFGVVQLVHSVFVVKTSEMLIFPVLQESSIVYGVFRIFPYISLLQSVIVLIVYLSLFNSRNKDKLNGGFLVIISLLLVVIVYLFLIVFMIFILLMSL